MLSSLTPRQTEALDAIVARLVGGVIDVPTEFGSHSLAEWIDCSERSAGNLLSGLASKGALVRHRPSQNVTYWSVDPELGDALGFE